MTTGGPPAPPAAPFPAGLQVTLDPTVRITPSGVLFGGSPPRLLRLSPAGQKALADLRRDGPTSPAAAVLARRLTDAGMAHPSPVPDPTPETTVIIPVKDRAPELQRVLEALRGRWPVIVADDGSERPGAVADACETHGARLVRLPASLGPASARNAGWRSAATELVAFLDSDAIPDPGWIEALAAHFADPLVGAAAPRIKGFVSPRRADRPVGRYAAARSPLDLGALPGLVRPGSRVSYVPTVALVARRSALVEVGGFDESLRYGEDVDLEWRLADAGWRVRYDPSITVRHEEPDGLGGHLERRFHYGTSAAGLSRRHPGRLYSLVLIPWAGLVVGGALGGRPRVALAGVAAGAVTLGRSRRGMRVPSPWALGARSVLETWIALGRWSAQFALPVVAVGLAWPGGRVAQRRLAIGALVAGAPALEWLRRRPPLDPLRFSALYFLDEAAYGTGVIWGCLRDRHWAPLRPRAILRQVGR